MTRIQSVREILIDKYGIAHRKTVRDVSSVGSLAEKKSERLEEIYTE